MFRSARVVLAVALVLGLGLGLASCTPLPRPNRRLKLTVESHGITARNGIEIFILPDPSVDVVQVDVRYEVGSAQDPKGKAGLAHLVEHLVFQVPATADANGPSVVQRLNEIALYYNAYTSLDSTHFSTLINKRYVGELLELEARRLTSGCTSIPNVRFEREREVVRNEIRERRSAQVDKLRSMLMQAIYSHDHPYGRAGGGGDDTQLASITLVDVCRFMAQHYVPSRVTVVLSGNTTTEEVRRLGFPALTKVRSKRTRKLPKMPRIRGGKRAVNHTLDVDETLIYVAWRLPAKFTRKFALARFVADNLRGHAALRVSGRTIVTIIGGARAPALVLGVAIEDADKFATTMQSIWDTVDATGRTMLLDRGEHARQRLVAYEPFSSRGSLLADFVQFGGHERHLVGQLEELASLKIRELQAYTRALLTRERVAVMVVKPDKKRHATYRRAKLDFVPSQHRDAIWKMDVDVQEAARPLDLPANMTTLARVSEFTLKNGLHVILWPDAQLPLAHGRIVVHSGHAMEPADKPGLALLVANYYGANVDDDATVFYDNALATEIDALILRLANTFKHRPKMKLDEMSSKRRRAFKTWETSRNRKFYSRLYQAVYGARHPYARSGFLTVNSLGRMRSKDLRAFAKTHYVASNATLIITGAFDPTLVATHVRARFAGVRSGKPSGVIPGIGQRKSGPHHIAVTANDSPVVKITMAFPAAAGINRDYAVRLVLARMLQARLFSVRNKLAVSYGISASYRPGAGPGIWLIEGMVDAKRADEALVAIAKQVHDLHKADDFLAEFVLARRKVARDLLVNLAASIATADRLEILRRYKLARDFRQRTIEQVATVTPDDVRRVLATELNRSRQTVALMGPKSAIHTAFVALSRQEGPAKPPPPAKSPEVPARP